MSSRQTVCFKALPEWAQQKMEEGDTVQLTRAPLFISGRPIPKEEVDLNIKQAKEALDFWTTVQEPIELSYEGWWSESPIDFLQKVDSDPLDEGEPKLILNQEKAERQGVRTK